MQADPVPLVEGSCRQGPPGLDQRTRDDEVYENERNCTCSHCQCCFLVRGLCQGLNTTEGPTAAILPFEDVDTAREAHTTELGPKDSHWVAVTLSAGVRQPKRRSEAAARWFHCSRASSCEGTWGSHCRQGRGSTHAPSCPWNAAESGGDNAGHALADPRASASAAGAGCDGQRGSRRDRGRTPESYVDTPALHHPFIDRGLTTIGCAADALLHWLVSHGGYMNALQVSHHVPEGRGLVATQPIPVRSAVMCVGASCD